MPKAKTKPTTKTVAAYCRVSTQHQRNDSQRAEIKRWLKGNGIKAADVAWFEDKASSKTLKRPAFEELQRAIFEGTVKTVVVWKLDRISRGQVDGMNVLADWCDKQVRFVSVTQQIDLRGVYTGRREGTTKAKPERAKELRDQGLTAAEVANAMGVSERSVFRYLTSG